MDRTHHQRPGCTVFDFRRSDQSDQSAAAIQASAQLGLSVAVQLLAKNPLFSQTLFPVYFGILVWAGLYLRVYRLRALIPVRS